MIQVSKAGDLKAARLCQVAEEEGERDRVRPARQADKHTAASGAEPVLANGAADLLMKSARQIPNWDVWLLGFLGMPEGGLEPPTPRL